MTSGQRVVLGLSMGFLGLLFVVCGLGCEGKTAEKKTASSPAPNESEGAKKFSQELVDRAQNGELDLDTVKRLTETADIDGQDEQGMTALHWSAKNGHMQTTEALLKAGANPTVVDKAGKTPLQYATEGNHGGTAGAIQAAMGLGHAHQGTPASPSTTEASGGQSASPTPPPSEVPAKQGLNPSLKYPDLPSFERAIGQPACLLTSEHVYFFAPKTREAEANVVFPYLVKAYDELYAIVGVHTEHIIVVYNFTKGHADAFGGTSNCVLYYDDTNLDLSQQDEWNKYQVPHVSGYIEEMAHNFVAATRAQFGWEMMGWSIGAMVSVKVAGNPIFADELNGTRQTQTDTFQRYVQLGFVLPPDVEPNLVDRIHAYLLWQCELAYGPNFWPDFFREVRKESSRFQEAAKLEGDNGRNARYQITLDCFDKLPGLNFKNLIRESGISLTTDIKSLHPTEPGWNRKLE